MNKLSRLFTILGAILTCMMIGYSLNDVFARSEEGVRKQATPTLVAPTAENAHTTPAMLPGIEQTATLLASQTAVTAPITATGNLVSAIPVPTRLPAEDWKRWPVIPQYMSPDLIKVYQRGLNAGNDPAAFSILGDCQSEPDVFMGIYDRDPAIVQTLPLNLQETVAQFRGSFDRYSPTVKGGTTEGALLWVMWNENLEGKCTAIETPLDCELRVQRPSIAFIHVGTHWETRNEHYLTTIIEKLLQNGTVPILVTKADNLEMDERVNSNLAKIAEKFNLPMWNFWASVQDLPRHGFAKDTEMLLSKQAQEIHRLGALQTLDFVWRALQDNDQETH